MATPAELLAMVQTLIIDNNTNQVTPAKVRAVLNAIIESIPGADQTIPTITAYSPLDYNGFTGEIRFLRTRFGEMRWIGKGYKWGTDPSEENGNTNQTTPEAGDYFMGSDFAGNFYISRWNGDGDSSDIANHVFAQSWRMRAPIGETPEEA